jgi:TonB family protein
MSKWAAALCLLALLARGQTDRVEQYRKELEQHRNSSEAHFWIGVNFIEQKIWQSAANELREALNGDLQPAWIEVWARIYLGEVLDISGQHDRALNEYRQAKRTKDDYAGAQRFVDELITQASPITFRLSTGLDRIVPPKVIERVEPEDTDEARLVSLQGTVQVVCKIGEDGSLRDVSVKQGLGLGLDERVVEAVRKWKFAPGTFDGRPVAMQMTVGVEYGRRPERTSGWHLAGAEFRPPEGASRPVIASAPFPAGSHLSAQAYETVLRFPARRSFKATISFEVDEHGVPRRFAIDTGALPGIGEEAIAFLRTWRFTPGLKDGAAIAVPCKFDFVWGL